MDLASTYLGLRLRNPLVASASPLARTVDGVRQLADAGIGAVVLPSLFEEQLRRESEEFARLVRAGADSVAESQSYLPNALTGPLADAADGGDVGGVGGVGGVGVGVGGVGSLRYLSLVRRAVQAVDVPVIASLNGITATGWTGYATALQDAGAAAIELNIYYLPGDARTSGQEVDQRHVDILTRVKAAVSVPVAVKLSPYFSSTGEIATRLDHAGADGLVLFNRFMQPDIDPEALAVSTGIQLSDPAEARLPRAWIALLHGRVRASLAASTGVEQAADVAAYLLAGADVVMTTSALLRHGPGHVRTLLDGLTRWMQRKGFASVDTVRGLLRVQQDDPQHDRTGYERAGYLGAIREATTRYAPD